MKGKQKSAKSTKVGSASHTPSASAPIHSEPAAASFATLPLAGLAATAAVLRSGTPARATKSAHCCLAYSRRSPSPDCGALAREKGNVRGAGRGSTKAGQHLPLQLHATLHHAIPLSFHSQSNICLHFISAASSRASKLSFTLLGANDRSIAAEAGKGASSRAARVAARRSCDA